MSKLLEIVSEENVKLKSDLILVSDFQTLSMWYSSKYITVDESEIIRSLMKEHYEEILNRIKH